MDKEKLTRLVKNMVMSYEAVAVGIATTETLEGGPPSTDLTYVLPEAKSAVVFALPMDQGAIESFLKKEDMASANIDNRRVNNMASGLAFEVSEFLNMKGYKSVPLAANAVYRKDTPNGPMMKNPLFPTDIWPLGQGSGISESRAMSSWINMGRPSFWPRWSPRRN